MSVLCHHLCAMRYLMYQSAMPDTASHASTRRQARTDGGGGEKESSVPELCSLESVCGQACVYRHIARCVFTTILSTISTAAVVSSTSLLRFLELLLLCFLEILLLCFLELLLLCEVVVATSAMICKKGFAPHTGACAIPPTLLDT